MMYFTIDCLNQLFHKTVVDQFLSQNKVLHKKVGRTTNANLIYQVVQLSVRAQSITIIQSRLRSI